MSFTQYYQNQERKKGLSVYDPKADFRAKSIEARTHHDDDLNFAFYSVVFISLMMLILIMAGIAQFIVA